MGISTSSLRRSSWPLLRSQMDIESTRAMVFRVDLDHSALVLVTSALVDDFLVLGERHVVGVKSSVLLSCFVDVSEMFCIGTVLADAVASVDQFGLNFAKIELLGETRRRFI